MNNQAKQVAVATNEVMRLESADQEAHLDVVLDYFCEDSRNNQQVSDWESDVSDEEDIHIHESHCRNTYNSLPLQVQGK